MCATPGQVANDLDAQASYFAKSDADLARLCRETARLIRQLQDGQTVEAGWVAACHARLLSVWSRSASESQIWKSLNRARLMIDQLRFGAPA